MVTRVCISWICELNRLVLVSDHLHSSNSFRLIVISNWNSFWSTFVSKTKVKLACLQYILVSDLWFQSHFQAINCCCYRLKSVLNWRIHSIVLSFPISNDLNKFYWFKFGLKSWFLTEFKHSVSCRCSMDTWFAQNLGG